jgi:hypothetical protein
MWKWVTVLCLGMYVTLMAFGGDGYDPDKVVETVAAEPVIVVEPVAVVEVEPVVEPDPVPEITVAAEPDAELPAPTQTAAVEVTETEIAPIAPVADPITVSAAPQATVILPNTVTDDPKPELPIWRVTGSRVNLRAAANGQAQIVGRTVRGDSAEIIEMLPSGWAKVYIIDSGIEAYMSADFISPDG